MPAAKLLTLSVKSFQPALMLATKVSNLAHSGMLISMPAAKLLTLSVKSFQPALMLATKVSNLAHSGMLMSMPKDQSFSVSQFTKLCHSRINLDFTSAHVGISTSKIARIGSINFSLNFSHASCIAGHNISFHSVNIAAMIGSKSCSSHAFWMAGHIFSSHHVLISAISGSMNTSRSFSHAASISGPQIHVNPIHSATRAAISSQTGNDMPAISASTGASINFSPPNAADKIPAANPTVKSAGPKSTSQPTASLNHSGCSLNHFVNAVNCSMAPASLSSTTGAIASPNSFQRTAVAAITRPYWPFSVRIFISYASFNVPSASAIPCMISVVA